MINNLSQNTRKQIAEALERECGKPLRMFLDRWLGQKQRVVFLFSGEGGSLLLAASLLYWARRRRCELSSLLCGWLVIHPYGATWRIEREAKWRWGILLEYNAPLVTCVWPSSKHSFWHIAHSFVLTEDNQLYYQLETPKFTWLPPGDVLMGMRWDSMLYNLHNKFDERMAQATCWVWNHMRECGTPLCVSSEETTVDRTLWWPLFFLSSDSKDELLLQLHRDLGLPRPVPTDPVFKRTVVELQERWQLPRTRPIRAIIKPETTAESSKKIKEVEDD